MGLMDYGNLKKQGADAHANQGWRPLNEGTFPAAFRGGKQCKTEGRGGKPKHDQFLHEYRLNFKDDEFMHKKDLKVRYILTFDFQVDRFLANMIDLGVDLDKITQDSDWQDVFDDMEEHRVKVLLKVYYNDTDKNEDGTIRDRAFPEIRIVGIIQGLPEESDWAIEGGWVAEEDDEETPAPKKSKTKKSKTKAPAKTKAKPAPEPEPEEVKEEEVEEPEEPETESDPSSEDEWD